MLRMLRSLLYGIEEKDVKGINDARYNLFVKKKSDRVVASNPLCI